MHIIVTNLHLLYSIHVTSVSSVKKIIDNIKKNAQKFDTSASESSNKIYMPLQRCNFEAVLEKIKQTTRANVNEMKSNLNYWCLISVGTPRNSLG